jgi:multiple sugar transport system substrate-binding protein
MMKKVLFLLLAVTVVGGFAFAGGGSQSSGTAGKTVISILEWGDVAGPGYDEKLRKIAEYEAAHPNVKIEDTVVPYDDYPAKLMTLQASGQLPDILALEEHRVLEFGDLGLLADLRARYAEVGINVDDWFISNQMFKSGNKVYGLGAAGAMNVLFYNKDLLRAAGVAFPPDSVTNPWTWDQFVAAATKLTKDNRGRTPVDTGFDYDNVAQWGYAINDWWIYTLPLLYAAGTSMANAQGTALEITKPAGIDAIQKFADLRLKNKVAPPAGAFPSSSAALMNGQLAMFVDGQWGFGSFQEERFDIGMAQIPAISGKGSNMVWGAGTTLTSKASPEAFEYFKYMYDTQRDLESCERTGQKFGGIVLTTNVINDPALAARFAKIVDPTFSKLTADIANSGSRIGENITLKNFTPIMYEYVQPAIELTMTGDATAAQAFANLDAQTRNLFQGTY